jgi:hypothetical protein
MIELGGREIVPIRGIPSHTGDFVSARDVAGLLADPESFGEMLGTGLVAHYRDGMGSWHRMYPYEFTAMQREIDAVPADADRTECIRLLMPGVLVFRKGLERVLYGFWSHNASRWAALDRGEFEFNPAPRLTPEEETLVYMGFEDLRSDGRVLAGASGSHAERLEDANRVLRQLAHRAAEGGITLVPTAMPGQIGDMVALLKRHSRVMAALSDDVVRGYINEAGYSYKGGRPRKDVRPHPLYALM